MDQVVFAIADNRGTILQSLNRYRFTYRPILVCLRTLLLPGEPTCHFSHTSHTRVIDCGERNSCYPPETLLGSPA